MRSYIKPVILFLVMHSCSFAAISMEKVMDKFIQICQNIQNKDRIYSGQEIQEQVYPLEILHQQKIKKLKERDYEHIYAKTDQIIQLTKTISFQLNIAEENTFATFTLGELLFLILDNLHANMEHHFSVLDYKAKLRNMLPVIQSRNAFNESKLHLVHMGIRILSYSTQTELKAIMWKKINEMMKSFQLNPKFELGRPRRKLSIQTIHQSIQLIDKLESLYILESDTLYKNTIVKYMNRMIDQKNKLYAEQTVLNEIQKYHHKQIKNLDDMPDVKSPSYEVLEAGITALEWFRKGYMETDHTLKIQHFSQSIQLDTTFTAAYINRGIAYNAIEQYEKAIPDFDHAISQATEMAEIFTNRGNSYTGLKKYDKAESEYDKAISLDPENQLAYDFRANNYRKQKKYELAISDYNKLNVIDPGNARTYHNRGITFYLSGQYEAALIDLKKAVELSPNYTSAYFNLGCIYWELKRWKKVIQSFEKCLEIDPEHTNARQWLEKAKDVQKPHKRTILIETITEE